MRLEWVVGAALALLVAHACYDYGKSAADAEWAEKWATESDTLGRARVAAVESALTEERRARAAAIEATENAHKQNATVDIGHADNGGAADRLRIDAARLANAASNLPSAATLAARSEAATRAAMVLSDLLDRSIETNRELALAYDRARIAGETCERVSDGQ